MNKNIEKISFKQQTKLLNKLVVKFVLLSFLIVLGACDSHDPEALTTMKIEDPYRKYFPIVQGQKLQILIEVENTGKEPLRISDVLTSCGCTTSKFPNTIVPGGFGIIEMEYNSIKNIGYVGFHTTILANTKEKSHTFFFETNVVTDALYTRDYEDLYEIQKKEEKGSIKEMVDGAANQKGYIIDSGEKRKFR